MLQFSLNYPRLIGEGSWSTHLRVTVSSGGSADTFPQTMTKSSILTSDCFSAANVSGNSWTMTPSSTMDDLPLRPLELFKAPFNTRKLAPVTISTSQKHTLQFNVRNTIISRWIMIIMIIRVINFHLFSSIDWKIKILTNFKLKKQSLDSFLMLKTENFDLNNQKSKFRQS